jgi:hypothetical protein
MHPSVVTRFLLTVRGPADYPINCSCNLANRACRHVQAASSQVKNRSSRACRKAPLGIHTPMFGTVDSIPAYPKQNGLKVWWWRITHLRSLDGAMRILGQRPCSWLGTCWYLPFLTSFDSYHVSADMRCGAVHSDNMIPSHNSQVDGSGAYWSNDYMHDSFLFVFVSMAAHKTRMGWLVEATCIVSYNHNCVDEIVKKGTGRGPEFES